MRLFKDHHNAPHSWAGFVTGNTMQGKLCIALSLLAVVAEDANVR